MEVNKFTPSESDVTFDKKIIPKQYQRPIQEALSYYPELKNVHIKFTLVKNGTPFVSRPTVFSTVFRSAKNRRYLILIAENSIPMFDMALMHNMPHHAQVGVIGHELAHTSDFTQRNTLRMLRVALGNLSPSYLNKFERDTDLRTIDHGLGCNLLSWSSWVRSQIDFTANSKYKSILEKMEDAERYLKPESIISVMKAKGNEPCSSDMHYTE